MQNIRKIGVLGDVNSIHLQKWLVGLMDAFEIQVFSLSPLDTSRNFGALIDGKISCFHPPKRWTDKLKLNYFTALTDLKRWYSKFQPDILHAHYGTSYGFLGGRLNAPTFFISVWGSDVFEFPEKSKIHARFLQSILKKADHVFSTSEVMAEVTRKYYKGRIDVIPFGINLEQFRKLETTKVFPTIGTIKKLEPTYGIDRLLRVSAEVKKVYPNLCVKIYGEGYQLEELEQLTLSLDLTDNVQFLGYVNNEELAEKYAELNLCCILSRRESFGVSAVEAGACEIPVICTNVGGLPEVVIHEKTGLVVKENLDEITQAVLRLLLNEEERERLGKAARKSVEERYNWTENLLTMKSFYQA